MRLNLKIWYPELCNISDNAQIGDNVIIHCGVVIYDDVSIGDNTKIQSGAFIPNGIYIGKDCFIGPKVVFTNDKKPPSNGKNWEKTIIESNVSIGAGAIILPGITIFRGSVIGAGSVVTKNVPAYTTVVGNPARPLFK